MKESPSHEQTEQGTTTGVKFNSIFIDPEEIKQLPEYKDLNRLTNSLYYDQSVYFKRSFANSRLYNTTSCFEAKKKRTASYDDMKPSADEIVDYKIDNSDLIFKDKVYSRTKDQLQNIYLKQGIVSKHQVLSPYNQNVRRAYLEKFSGERLQAKMEAEARRQNRLAKTEVINGEKVFVTAGEAHDLSGLTREDEKKFQKVLKEKIKEEKDVRGHRRRSKKEEVATHEQAKEAVESPGKNVSPRRPNTSTKNRERLASNMTVGEGISLLDHVRRDLAKVERERIAKAESEVEKKAEAEKQQKQREEKAAATVAFKNNLVSKRKFAFLFTGKWVPVEKVQQAIEAGEREPVIFQVIDKFQPTNASNSNPYAMLLTNDKSVYNDKQLEARKKNIEKEQKEIMRVVRMCTPADRDAIKETRKQFQKDMLMVKAIPLSWDPTVPDDNESRKTRSRTPTPFRPGDIDKTTIQQPNSQKEQLFQTEVTNFKRPQSRARSVASSTIERPSTANNTISVKPKSSGSQRNNYDYIVKKQPSSLNVTQDGFRIRPKSTERTEGLISRKSQYSGGGFRGTRIVNLKASEKRKGSESVKSDKFEEEHAKTALIFNKLDELQENLFEPVNLSKKLHKRLENKYQLIDEKYEVAKIEKEFMQ